MIALIAYCVYQVLVPRLARRRADAAATRFAEKQRQMRAVSVLQKFPAFTAKPNDLVDSETLARHQQEAAALAVAKRW